MADDISKKITIGVEMETDKLTENITSLNKSIDGLLAKQQQLNEAGQKNSAAFENISAKLEALQKKLQDATTQVTANTAALNSLSETSKAAGNSISALADQHQKNAKAANDSSAQIKELSDQVSSLGTSNKATEGSISALADQHQKNAKAASDSSTKTKELSGQVGSLGTSNKTAAGFLSSLAASHQKNTKAAGDSSTKTKVLSGQIKSLGNAAKQQKANTDRSKSSLDGYAASASKGASNTNKLQGSVSQMGGVLAGQTNAVNTSKTAFDAHKATMDHLKTSFDEIKNVSGIFGPSLKEAADGFNAMKNGLSIVQGGLKGIGEAIQADGFGFLLQILQYLFNAFVQSSTGSKMLQGAISAIGVVINDVKGFIDALKNGMLDAVSHPIESIKALGTMIEENIVNRFKAFSVILDGIVHLDFKKVANGVLQAATGVTNVIDKTGKLVTAAKNGIKQVAGQMVTAFNTGYDQAGKLVDKHEKKVKDSTNKQIEYYQKLLAKTRAAYAAQKKQTEEAEAKQKQQAKEDKNADCKCDEQNATGSSPNNGENADKEAKIKEEQQAAQDKLMEKDQENTDKANGPDAKLAADKKLITDKYQFEIEQAKGNADAITALKTELNGKLKTLQDDFDKKKADAKKADQKKLKDEALKDAQQIEQQALSLITAGIKQQTDAKIAALEKDKSAELSNSSLTSAQKLSIEQKYKQQEGKIKAKAFKEEQEASIAQALINGALAITKVSSQSGVLAPLEIGITIAETAMQVAKIAAQKPPAYAKGGLHYASDGRGGVLPGYSRTDNTNAYLRSGEGVVVSEAMQVPWARNLVSAINVGFGGRDFSITNPGRGYAVGGIFTDGGDANRYYNAPVNDQKNLANTIAYQMVNNFPPVYVDVKDVNNQQNILAQTVNRVNL